MSYKNSIWINFIVIALDSRILRFFFQTLEFLECQIFMYIYEFQNISYFLFEYLENLLIWNVTSIAWIHFNELNNV